MQGLGWLLAHRKCSTSICREGELLMLYLTGKIPASFHVSVTESYSRHMLPFQSHFLPGIHSWAEADGHTCREREAPSNDEIHPKTLKGSENSYLDFRSPNSSNLDLLVSHEDPEASQPSRPCIRFFLVNIDLQVVWSLRAGLQEGVGKLGGKSIGGTVKGVQHLVLVEQAHGLPLREAALVAVLHRAHLPAAAGLVEAVDVPAFLTQALHCAVGRGPEELPHGIVVAVKVTAALVQWNTLTGAEHEALVTLAALCAWCGAVLRSCQVRARVRTTAGTHGIVAEVRALHRRH